MDESFHGDEISEDAMPAGLVPRIDTLSKSCIKTHGDFQLRLSDTVLNTGNGRVWADWAATGAPFGTALLLPYIGFFSQRHRLALKFGWMEIVLRAGGKVLRPYRARSWCQESAIPVTEIFFFEGHKMLAWCAAVPGEARLALHIRITPRGSLENAVVVLRGATTLGEEAGSPYDAVNGTVGDRKPLSVRLCSEVDERSLLIKNPAAAIQARLSCSRPIRCEIKNGQVTVDSPDGPLAKDHVRFELHCPLTDVPPLARHEELEVGFELVFDAPLVSTTEHPLSLEEVGRAWRDEWLRLEPLATNDPVLTAALKRAAVYSASLLPVVDSTGTAPGMSDHVEWPVDCARDCCHVAESLLFLKPELVRRHLAFYFHEAIPRAGVGKSYVPTGETRGHSDARLLDLAAYPLWHLWRYWKATGDDTFAASPHVRDTVDRIISETLLWRHDRTGLLTSVERSSDERCVFPVFVPGNAMFIGALERMAELCQNVWGDPDTAQHYRMAALPLREKMWRHTVVDDQDFGNVFAFEVGGEGEFLLYEQADMPNLLSMPRYGFCAPTDPVYQNTMRFAFSNRNQGFRWTADGKYRHLCDGSKTMPSSPWPLGPLGQLLSGAVTPREAARLFDWLRDSLTPALQLPEICDAHTALPVQRYWFGWPTAALLSAFIETICGITLGEDVTIRPMLPEGWDGFSSPRLTVRGKEVLIKAENGRTILVVDDHEVDARRPFSLP